MIIQIERAVGEMLDSVFNESVTNADQILTRSRSARSREAAPSSPKRQRVFPAPSGSSFTPSFTSTMPSSNPSTVLPLRKGPSALNKPRIPCKEPRRMHVINETSPTPNSVFQGGRNASQNGASNSSQRLVQPMKIIISSKIIDAFKDLSNENTLTKKETGALLVGRREGGEFILDTIFVPKQVGHADRFETVDETDTFNFFNDNPELLLLGVIHTHPGFESFLSSVDLHMLYNYACSHSFVISIVLAPELNTFPAYVLTKKGLETLRACKKTGFHRHK